jgi:dienelactone hydrolase
VVALHGAGQDAHRAVVDWAAAVENGWILVAPHSSQRSTPTYRTWPEQEVAAADVAAALGHLTDDERALTVVAGGFSAGGRAALLWALSAEPCPVAGVIAVGPAVDDVPAPEGRDVRGVVIVGTADDLVDGARRFSGALPAVRLDEVEGLDHVYPDDFADRLTAALQDLAG